MTSPTIPPADYMYSGVTTDSRTRYFLMPHADFDITATYTVAAVERHVLRILAERCDATDGIHIVKALRAYASYIEDLQRLKDRTNTARPT